MAKLYRALTRTAIISMVAFLAVSACLPRRLPPPQAALPGNILPPPPGPGKEAQPRGQPGAPPPPLQMNANPRNQGAQEGKKRPAQEAALPPELVSERSFGLLAPPGTILPSDARIGALEDLGNPEVERRAMVLPATTLMDGLLEGKLSPGSILPSRLALVSLMAAGILDGPRPRAWRLGTLRTTAGEDSALAYFSLAWPGEEEGEETWVTGELGLREKDKVWLVESLSLEGPPPRPAKGG